MWAASSNCLPDEAVFAFVHGELSGEAAKTFEEHLNCCVDCRTVVAETARFLFQDAQPDVTSDTLSCPPARDETPSEYCLLSSGARVSRYVIGGLIGVGAAGVVYSAHDPQLRRKIALKLMRPDHSQQPYVDQVKPRLLREARAMAQLSHPNVVTVFDVGTFEDQVFIVMELVEGATLAHWLEHKTRPWQEVVWAFAEAGRGLAAAHAVQIVHRDFKPANVLVGSDGRVRVTDFGLAHPMGIDGAPVASTAAVIPATAQHSSATLTTWTATEGGGLAGTPVFMAPEQFLRRRPGARTDQFSFCVALYMALYGHHPFNDHERRTLATLARDVVAGRLRPPPGDTDVPTAVFDALARGLRADPEERFASMQDLLDALTSDRAKPERRQPSRHRRALGAAALVAAVAIIVSAVAAGRRPESRTADHARPLETVPTSPFALPAAAAIDPPISKPDSMRDSTQERGANGELTPKAVPHRSAPRPDRKVRTMSPRPERTRYEDGLKDPF